MIFWISVGIVRNSLCTLYKELIPFLSIPSELDVEILTIMGVPLVSGVSSIRRTKERQGWLIAD